MSSNVKKTRKELEEAEYGMVKGHRWDVNMTGRTKRLLDHYKRVYISALGNISKTCRILGIDRQVFYDLMKRYPEWKKELQQVEEITIDFVEEMLLKNVAEQDTASIIFFLKNKGRERGYRSDSERTKQGDTNIQVNVGYSYIEIRKTESPLIAEGEVIDADEVDSTEKG